MINYEKNRILDDSYPDRVASIYETDCVTPAFVYDEAILFADLNAIREKLDRATCELLYALKACSVRGMLELISGNVSGFSCSSLFESWLAIENISNDGSVHFTAPGLREDQIESVSDVCDYVSFNSLTQWKRFKNSVSGKTLCGLRINPKLSLVGDERYDPCRAHSKLGVPLEELVLAQTQDKSVLKGISGLHVHTNCDSKNMNDLCATVFRLEKYLLPLMEQVDWLNLGGGYLFAEARHFDDFCRSIERVRSKYRVRVFVEPGAALIRRAGNIVSTVIDIFSSDNKQVAVIDTSVNHMPEVFEYQYEPEVLGHTEGGHYRYVLAGCSCLSGDLFGEYTFEQPLEVGSRVLFKNTGAYTLVKAHMFNGINLPSVYRYTSDGRIELEKQFSYDDYKSIWGERSDASIRERAKDSHDQAASRLASVS